MYKFQLKKFSNGLRLLMVPSKEALSFQVSVLVNTGSEFETKNINGISHFLEHLCFKGTKKRPSNFEITKELDSVGGSYNAFTGDEVTGYWTRVAAKDKDLALDIVSDIYLNSQFPELEINKERGVIMEEINMYQDIPQSYIWDLWGKLLYGNQPAGRRTLGSKENIKKFKREDFLKYCSSQYRAKSSLVIISGNFQFQEMMPKVKDAFADIKRGQGKIKVKTKERQTKPQVISEYKKTDQTHLILGVRGFNLFDKRRYGLDVLDAIFDGGMSSILFQTVRDRLGAAYYVHTVNSSGTDHGFWAVKAGLDTNRFEQILKIVLQEWVKFKNEPIPPQVIQKAKNYIYGKVSLSLENVHNVAYDLAGQELLKKQIETPKEYLRKIKLITANDLRRIANDLLQSRNLNLAFIGPNKNTTKLKKLLTM